MSIEIPCHVLDWVVGKGEGRSAFVRLPGSGQMPLGYGRLALSRSDRSAN